MPCIMKSRQYQNEEWIQESQKVKITFWTNFVDNLPVNKYAWLVVFDFTEFLGPIFLTF